MSEAAEISDTLYIYVAQANVKSAAYFNTALVSLLFVGAICLLVFDKVKSEGLMADFLISGIFLWLFAALFGGCVSLFKLSKFEGPLFTLEPDGITDHWVFPEQKFAWSDIKKVQWQFYQRTVIFEIKLQNFSALMRMRRLCGDMRLRFPVFHLDVSHALLSEFLLQHAPTEILHR